MVHPRSQKLVGGGWVVMLFTETGNSDGEVRWGGGCGVGRGVRSLVQAIQPVSRIGERLLSHLILRQNSLWLRV